MHLFSPKTEMKALLSQSDGAGIHTVIYTISGKATIRSDSRESSRLLWNPESSLPFSQHHATGSCSVPIYSVPRARNLRL